MQSAENYTSLVDRRLSAPDYLTDCSAQSSDHVVSLVSYSLPQQGRRSTRGLASSTWCRWWRRAPRSGLAHVTQKQIDGESSCQCSFCTKQYACTNYTRVCC